VRCAGTPPFLYRELLLEEGGAYPFRGTGGDLL